MLLYMEEFMKLKIKSKGKVVREKELRNKMHFEVQKNTRGHIAVPKTVYNRQKSKKMCLDY